ncbi:ABC transporter permease [Verrucomicrobiota bacterium]
MDFIADGIKEALKIIATLDREFVDIVLVSLRTAGTSTALAALAGVPFGVFVGLKMFPGRRILISILNTLMSLPTVAVGLLVYSFICRRGPAGELGLLYTVTAMVIGQFILVFPIIASLTITAVSSTDVRIKKTLVSIGADSVQSFFMFIREIRFGLFAAVIAGFGRVFAEVGISMMLGGNIMGYTRNITTAMALEVSKGEFALGFALGIVLLSVAFGINGLLIFFQGKGK